MNIFEYVKNLCTSAKDAAPALAISMASDRNRILAEIADGLIKNTDKILSANDIDIKNAEDKGIRASLIDRLRLTDVRIKAIADSLDELIRMKDPLGVGERWIRPNGLEINKVKVPMGVIGIIYESRPNVTVDAAALCIKSGNAVVLRGGSEAIESNKVLIQIMRGTVSECGYSPDVISLIENTDRESATALMKMRGLIDVLIPRGTSGLINSVIENSKIPVIETGAGNCHLYADSSADIDMAVKVAVNAKVSRPSVCNAVETILVHEDCAEEFLHKFAKEAVVCGIEIRGCEKTCAHICAIIPDDVKETLSVVPATDEDYFTEYGDLIVAVKVVSSVDEAIRHINHYSTGHSEAIITKDMENARKFENSVDSAAVYVNASTRFTDGGEFGFGAEIGISTQKLHARGPMGLEALTTDKYIIRGNGQIRI